MYHESRMKIYLRASVHCIRTELRGFEVGSESRHQACHRANGAGQDFTLDENAPPPRASSDFTQRE